MQLSDFHYTLPPELIARYPLERRSDSRLLCLDGQTGLIQHQHFRDITGLLQPGDLLVFNNTRVIQARLFGQKATGGKFELLVEKITSDHRVLAHVRASKSPKPGTTLLFDKGIQALVVARADDLFEIEFLTDEPVLTLLEAIGHIPLPPYFNRNPEAIDIERYQTVYAEQAGAVAAPTAGLHFDEALLNRLQQQGVELGFLTLHVGAGTFQPVRVDNIEEHVMHSEYFDVSKQLCEQILAARARKGRVIAVGTTSARALESAVRDGNVCPMMDETRIFIYPGYRFQCVDALITNFHLPESTLLMLVSAFAGFEPIMKAYEEAVKMGYRFFSYGDAMWLTRALI